MQSSPVTVYYSTDPISNLQIRVLLRKQPDEPASLSNPRTLKQLNLALKDKARKEEIELEATKRREMQAGNMSAEAVARAGGTIEEGDEAAAASAMGSLNASPLTSPRRDSDGRRMLGAAADLSSSQQLQLQANFLQPDVVATQLFSWQQKVCSPTEVYLAALGRKSASSYADQVLHVLRTRYPSGGEGALAAAGPSLEVAARRWIAEAPQGMVLSSKRDHDRYIDPDDLYKRVTTTTSNVNSGKLGGQQESDAARPRLNPLAARIVLAPLAARRGDHHWTREGMAVPFHILATVELPHGAPDRVRLVNRDHEETDLHPPGVAGAFQKPLACLKVTESSTGGDGGGDSGASFVTLEMRPPFSPPLKDPTGATFDDSEWYSFHTPAGEHFRYRIENYSALQDGDMDAATAAASGKKGAGSSSSILIEERKLEAEMARLALHEMNVQVHRSGREFDQGPPRGFEQWKVFGEITKLVGFEEEDLSAAADSAHSTHARTHAQACNADPAEQPVDAAGPSL